MADFLQPPDGAFLPAEALRPLLRDDAIKAGPAMGSITPAAPPPEMNDRQVRELVEEISSQAVPPPAEPSRWDYIKDYGLAGAILMGPVVLILSQQHRWVTSITMTDALLKTALYVGTGFAIGALWGIGAFQDQQRRNSSRFLAMDDMASFRDSRRPKKPRWELILRNGLCCAAIGGLPAFYLAKESPHSQLVWFAILLTAGSFGIGAFIGNCVYRDQLRKEAWR